MSARNVMPDVQVFDGRAEEEEFGDRISQIVDLAAEGTPRVARSGPAAFPVRPVPVAPPSAPSDPGLGRPWTVLPPPLSSRHSLAPRLASNGAFPSPASNEAPRSRVTPANGIPLPVAAEASTLSDYLVWLLLRMGIDTAFGLTGGAVAHFCAALARGHMNVIHCRHEAGAVFAAIEAYYIKDRPAVVFTTTGPGLMNALTGIAAAYRDGAKLLLISGATSAPQRGRWAFQETSSYSMPVSGLFTAGPLFHHAATIEQPVELSEAMRRVTAGLAKPGGFVAHLSLPLSTQVSQDYEVLSSGRMSILPLRSADATAAECAQLLMREPFAIWVGFGARNASRQVRELVRRTGAAVMCSPRGKGIFPEDDPHFVGVTGFGGHEGVFAYMAERRPAYILVLGTRLGEFTSFWSPDLAPAKGFIHVDIDPEVHGAAYPDSNTIGVQADIKSFVEALLACLPRREPPPPYRAPDRRPPEISVRPDRLVRPSFLMAAIQQVIVEGSDAPVITEAGNAFAWGTNALRFASPGRYRVSTGYGSMGHAVTGVVGMALACRGKAVAIAGDGAMLMNSEISTAVQYGIRAVWIVLNDSMYGMIDQGMRALGLPSVETAIPGADFVMIARGMGADGVRVSREEDVVAALEQAMASLRPFVVDVVIDPSEPAPAGRRFKSLIDDQFT